MLKTVEISRAQKTKGVAVTYRAGENDNFGTCPSTCELNPSGCGASKVDQDYLDAVSDAVPHKGVAFTYSHFSPLYWAKKLKPGKTVINYSAKTVELAARYVKQNIPTVCAVPLDFWEGKKSRAVDGVNVVRCPAEYRENFGCNQCGAGDPLCAQLKRRYAVGFTAHGVHKKKAANPDEAGGCYATGGNVLIHWTHTADQNQEETDGDKLRRFAKSLAPRTILRHHIAGDIGAS